MDVEKGKENLGKAEKFKKAAMKKKVIFAAVIIVLVLVILLIILSEFGAFSGGGGGTTIVNHYIYKYPNGTEVTSDHELADGSVLLGTTMATTTSTAAPEATADPLDYLDYEGPGK